MQLLLVVAGIVCASLALAAVLTLGVRRLFRGRTSLLTNEGGSPALRAITATYALLLAFVLATSLQSFQSARAQTVAEADTVVSLSNLALLLPAPSGHRVEQALTCYAFTVVNHDFPAMRAGGTVPDNDVPLEQIYRTLPNLDHTSPAATGIANAILVQLSSLTNARDARIRAARSQLPWLLWVVVIGGGIVALLALTAVTYVERPWAQFWLLTGAAAILFAALLLIESLGSPFAGVGVRIDSGPMQSALHVVSSGVSKPYCVTGNPG